MAAREPAENRSGWQQAGACCIRSRRDDRAAVAEKLRHAADVPGDLLAHISPISWDNVVLYTPDEIELQIQATLSTRARHRLMIFSQKSKTLARTAPNRFIAEIQNFRPTQPADRYLFAVWHNEGPACEFRVYVHA